MANTQAPSHWSKDFVEHLRTVHFALIAVSAGLILLLCSSKSYNPIVADRELEEILELHRLWSPQWVESLSEENDSVDFFHAVGSSMQMPIELGGGDKAIHEVVGTVLSKEAASYLLKLPAREEMWFIGTNEFHSRDTSSSRGFSLAFDTLSEFESWWNDLKKQPTVVIPQSLCPVGWLTDRGHEFSTTNEKRILLTGVPLDRSAIPPAHKMILVVTEDMGKSGTTHFSYNLETTRFEDPGQFIQIPFCSLAKSKVTQELIISYFKNWQTGSFRSVFQDLNSAAAGYKMLKLERLSKLISDDAGKGTEVFEAFGIKFPAGQITFWGNMLLLCVQLYLLVYLRQLSGKLKAEDPGWDVPWIGMDSSRVSQKILFFSLVILPCTAAIVLGWEAIIGISSGYWERTDEWTHPIHLLAYPWHWHYTVVLKISLLILATIASGCLGLLSWKYRPQIAPELRKLPSCPTQLFE